LMDRAQPRRAMSKLKDRVAVVTGASRGIGAAIARRLAADGAKVVVNYARDEKSAVSVSDAIRAAGGTAIPAHADVTDEAQVQAMLERTMKELGRLDILVNNAGIFEFKTLDVVDRATFLRMMDVNLWSVLLASREAARHFGESGGRIINISSTAARMGVSGVLLYSATKAGLEAVTRCLAAELGPKKICVNAVAPGLIETDMTAGFAEEVKRGVLLATPVGRMGTPEEVGHAVAFLASDEAACITGQVLPVNGGFLM
jgi:3-oxoacyl-[acyl-carrier protein] reductase